MIKHGAGDLARRYRFGPFGEILTPYGDGYNTGTGGYLYLQTHSGGAVAEARILTETAEALEQAQRRMVEAMEPWEGAVLLLSFADAHEAAVDEVSEALANFRQADERPGHLGAEEALEDLDGVLQSFASAADWADGATRPEAADRAVKRLQSRRERFVEQARTGLPAGIELPGEEWFESRPWKGDRRHYAPRLQALAG
ncbi:hypothetical protein ACFVVA_37115 [Kitasatospora sp. NPDC058048]|uniref:hypothetical protein n=1 Tax=Kitasatospora sp. NPDC058048 TaxID=3346313 RepID=UPI0036DB3BC4